MDLRFSVSPAAAGGLGRSGLRSHQLIPITRHVGKRPFDDTVGMPRHHGLAAEIDYLCSRSRAPLYLGLGRGRSLPLISGKCGVRTRKRKSHFFSPARQAGRTRGARETYPLLLSHRESFVERNSFRSSGLKSALRRNRGVVFGRVLLAGGCEDLRSFAQRAADLTAFFQRFRRGPVTRAERLAEDFPLHCPQ